MEAEASLLTIIRRRLKRIARSAIEKKFYMLPKNVWQAYKLKKSKLFDSEWYLKNYPDVSRSGADPVAHFIQHGAREGRNPSSLFDTMWYCRQYPDVTLSGYNPVIHHILIGEHLGRKTIAPTQNLGWWEAPEQERANWNSLSIRDEIPAVIIPIYNAVEELRACVSSVLRNSGLRYRLILIDDNSPDPEISVYLAELKDIKQIEIYRNSNNLGFTKTINRGIEIAGKSDVIFLNSDTEVTPSWIKNLRIAAYSAADIGTVSPFSNNAGAFSAPELGQANSIPSRLDRDEWGRAVTQMSRRIYPRVPTTHGFCMYVRRDCLNAVGKLDEDAFPRGYGEENDFCMRSGRAGWKHIIDDSTIIYHVRSASFGEAKTPLMEAGRRVIDKRYPEYKSEIRVFSASSDVSRARENVRRALDASSRSEISVLPRILYVLSTRTGGTPQTNQDLMSALDGVAETLVLRCDASRMNLQIFRNGQYTDLETVYLKTKILAFPHKSEEYDLIIRQWMIKYSVELLHVRHISWHSLGLLTEARMLGIPIVFSIHDFYTLCPTVKLLDENTNFCGGTCTISKGECQHELWNDPTFPPLKHKAIHSWQKMFADVLKLADVLITTSNSAREIVVSKYPELDKDNFIVIPHGRDFQEFQNLSSDWKPNEPLRVLVPGNISVAKGGALLKRLLDQAPKGSLEIHVMGNIANDTGLRKSVVDHGTYHRNDFSNIVAKIRPHIGAVFSVWPETYCHTLTEMWSCGVPVAGVDFGAVAERIRASDAGWIIDHTDTDNLWNNLLSQLQEAGSIQRRRAAVLGWQRNEGLYSTTQLMGAHYFLIYGTILGVTEPSQDDLGNILTNYSPNRSGIIATVCPSQSKNHGQASTYIRVWEKTRNRLGYSTYYLRSTSRELVSLVNSGVCSSAIIQRNALPVSELQEFIKLVEDGKLSFIYDIDDDLLNVPSDKDPKGIYSDYSRSLRQLISNASCVTVPVTALRKTMLPLNPNVEVVTNQLSRRLWGTAPTFLRSNSKIVRALYMGTKTHDADLHMIRPALERVAQEFPNFRFKIIGGLLKPWTAGENWMEIIELENSIKSYPNFVPWFRQQCKDVNFALAPMAGHNFNGNKSGLKFLDYAGMGLCGLFSNMPVYAEVIDKTGCGRLVDSDGWEQALRLAIADPTPLQEDGLKAREWVVRTQMFPKQIEGISESK